MMDKIKTSLQSEHVEVTLRMGVTMFLGYVATFANITAIPIETNILLGILVPFCTMLFPTLMFTFGSIILPLLSVFLLIFLSTSLLLSIAVVGGSGAYVAAFAIWCFWITFFRFDKAEGVKCSLVLIAVVFQTVLIWPTYDTVQNGFIVPNRGVPPLVNEALMGFTKSAVEDAKLLGVGMHNILINTGTLAGQIATVTINADGSSQAFIEGGMWIIKGMWTFTGTQNPLAVNSNFTIFTCWLILILAVAVLTPPFRTMRSAVWRGIIPSALKDAASSIRLHAARMDKHLKEKSGDIENGVGVDSASNEEKDTSEESRLVTRGRCVYHINALFGGTLAKYTAFEPRLVVRKPLQSTTGILVQLSSVVSRCVRIAVGIELLTQMDDEKEFLYHNIDQYLEVANILETCAKALMIGNAKLLDGIDNRKDDKVVGQPLKTTGKDAEPLIAQKSKNIASRSLMKGAYEIIDEEDEESVIVVEKSTYDPFKLKKYAYDVVALSRRWIEAMDPSSVGVENQSYCESIMVFLNILHPWLLVQFSHFKFMAQLIANMFKKSSWMSIFCPSQNISSAPSRLIWCIKYTIGMTVLLAMPVYWPAYRQDFVLAVSNDDPMRGIYAAQNAGWALVAYCFATTQTTEGSVKKGILRMLGTVVGAFSGWLALVVCEDDSFEYTYNTYGVVAWLTITSFIATYVSTERGFAARISLSNDYAYGPIYFVLTQIIIVGYGYYYYPTSEGRDIITINRLMANLMGIGLAIVLALIPPGLWGSDPVHCRSMVRYHWNATIEILRTLLSCPLIPDSGEPVHDFCMEAADELHQLVGSIQGHSSKMQELAVDFEKDAARLQKLPRFQVDPRLKIETAKVTRDIHITAFLPLLASDILSDERKRAILLGRESDGRRELEALLSEMEEGIGGSARGKKDMETESHSTMTVSLLSNQSPEGLSEAETDVELLLRTIRWLRDEMYQHEETLDTIKWGF